MLMLAGVAATSLTVAVALGRFGAVVLAVIVAVPGNTPVTGTFTVVALAAKVTVAGTVATVASLEARLITNPAGAGADNVSTRFCVAVPVILAGFGVSAMVAATFTGSVAGV